MRHIIKHRRSNASGICGDDHRARLEESRGRSTSIEHRSDRWDMIWFSYPIIRILTSGTVSKAIELDARHLDSLLCRAHAWAAKRTWAKAIIDYDSALRLDPRNADAYFNRATCLALSGNKMQSLSDYGKVLELDSKNVRALVSRSTVWIQIGEWDHAEKDLSKVIELDPRFASGWSAHARLLAACPVARLRDGKRAIVEATRACELNSWRDPLYLGDLACACAEAGQFDEAIKWQRQALKQLKLIKNYDSSEERQRLSLFEERKPWRLLSPNAQK